MKRGYKFCMAGLACSAVMASGCSWLKTMVVTNKSSHAVCIAYLSHPKDDEKCVTLEPGEQTEFRFVSSSGGEFSIQRNEKAEPKVVVLPEGEPESKIVRRKVYAEYDGEKVTLIAPKRFFIF